MQGADVNRSLRDGGECLAGPTSGCLAIHLNPTPGASDLNGFATSLPENASTRYFQLSETLPTSPLLTPSP
jgi:hypothetical protein